MECPHCGEDNLPGLARCFACGRDLAPDPGKGDPAVPLVPRVRAANPLADRPVRRKDAPLLRSWTLDLVRYYPRIWPYLAGFWGAALGIVPGLGPALRGRWRLAGLQVGAVILALLFAWAWWQSPSVEVAWFLLWSAFCWSCAEEVRGRFPVAEPFRTFAALCFAGALVFGLRTAVIIAFYARYPHLNLHADMGFAEPGEYLLDPRRAPGVGDLVGIVERGWAGVGRVVALPGEPVPGEARLVPEDALWVTVAREADAFTGAWPGRAVPLRDIEGTVVYRWRPYAERGPYTPLPLPTPPAAGSSLAEPAPPQPPVEPP